MAGSLLGCDIPYGTAALFDRRTRPFSSGLAQNRRRNQTKENKERREQQLWWCNGAVRPRFQAPQLIPRSAISATHPHPGRDPDGTPASRPGQINVRHRPLFH